MFLGCEFHLPQRPILTATWIVLRSKFPHENERLVNSNAMLEVLAVADAKDDAGCVQQVTVRATSKWVPDDIKARYEKLRVADSEMCAIRAHPHIQQYEQWMSKPTGKPFALAPKHRDVHRRFRNRAADLFEMIARDDDLERTEVDAQRSACSY